MVGILPEGAFSVFADIEFLPGSAGYEFDGIRNNIGSVRIRHKQMNMV
jgi:hypothetical protein